MHAIIEGTLEELNATFPLTPSVLPCWCDSEAGEYFCPRHDDEPREEDGDWLLASDEDLTGPVSDQR